MYNHSMQAHEQWRLIYRARRYMDHLASDHLEQRAADVFHNPLTITSEGKLGVLPGVKDPVRASVRRRGYGATGTWEERNGHITVDLTDPFEKKVRMLEALFKNLQEEKRWVAQEEKYLIDSLRDVLDPLGWDIVRRPPGARRRTTSAEKSSKRFSVPSCRSGGGRVGSRGRPGKNQF
jgi:hypothetical protein